MDGTFGIIYTGSQENITNDILTNGFYKRLILDDSENGFLEKLKTRWNELRSTIISNDLIIESFNTQFKYLETNGVYERELKIWQNCESFDYNNIEYTSEWLQKRLTYLDKVFNNPELLTSVKKHNITKETEFRIFPKPANNYLYFEATYDNCIIEKISIFNFLGQPLNIISTSKNNGRINISNLNGGVYFVIADFKNGFRQVKKLIISK